MTTGSVPPLPQTRASQHLDLIRGLAAVAVLIYHVRYRFFLDYGDLPERGLATFSMYLLTSFGHDAVMVFFVLSGFLIGSTVIRNLRQGRWSWREYLTSRLVRLYVVLLPGLLLTVLWDQLGLRFFGGNAIYTGHAVGYVNDYFDVAARLRPTILAANTFFLQQIVSPPFGSNDALWSLSFEFWYYMVFPFFVLGAFGGRRLWGRLAHATAGAVLLALIGGQIARYFPIWLLGVAVSLLPVRVLLLNRPWQTVAVPLGIFMLVAASTHATIVRRLLGGLWAVDMLTAFAFAGCLFLVLHDRRPARSDVYGRLSARLSSCSFSLYVVHLPALVFLRAWLVPDRPWSPSPTTVGISALIVVGLMAYAMGLARLTEARTNEVRSRVLRLLDSSAS